MRWVVFKQAFSVCVDFTGPVLHHEKHKNTIRYRENKLYPFLSYLQYSVCNCRHMQYFYMNIQPIKYCSLDYREKNRSRCLDNSILQDKWRSGRRIEIYINNMVWKICPPIRRGKRNRDYNGGLSLLCPAWLFMPCKNLCFYEQQDFNVCFCVALQVWSLYYS